MKPRSLRSTVDGAEAAARHEAPLLRCLDMDKPAALIVTGSLHARLDTIDELRALAIEHVARSLGEPGCLEHGVSIDANDGLRLVFFERWADRDALDAHFKVPATRAFARRAAELVARPAELAVYEAGEAQRR